MKKNKRDITKVIFRKFEDGEIIALFPEQKLGNGLIGSYMHIGQHSPASEFIVDDTTLATEDEYRELKAELESIGYHLEIRKRMKH